MSSPLPLNGTKKSKKRSERTDGALSRSKSALHHGSASASSHSGLDTQASRVTDNARKAKRSSLTTEDIVVDKSLYPGVDLKERFNASMGPDAGALQRRKSISGGGGMRLNDDGTVFTGFLEAPGPLTAALACLQAPHQLKTASSEDRSTASQSASHARPLSPLSSGRRDATVAVISEKSMKRERSRNREDIRDEVVLAFVRHIRSKLDIRTHITRLLRYPKSFTAADLLDTVLMDEMRMTRQQAIDTLQLLDQSHIVQPLTQSSSAAARFDKNSFYRFNMDHKRRNRQAIDAAFVRRLRAHLDTVAAPFVDALDDSLNSSTVSPLSVDDVSPALMELRARLTEMPLQTPEVISVELLKELRSAPAMEPHRVALDYVIGTLSGQKMPPLLAQITEGADEGETVQSDLQHLLMHYSSGASTQYYEAARVSQTTAAAAARRRRRSKRGGGGGGGGTTRSATASQTSLSVDDAEVVTERLMADLCRWDFDMFAFDRRTEHRPLFYTGLALFKHHGLTQAFRISLKVLCNWLRKVESLYADNPYHNCIHAADVTQSVNFFLTTCGLSSLLSDEDVFALIVAAIVHDLDHVGRNNAFLIQTNNELALLHNDRSVLENHHIHTAFRVTLESDECNIFKNLETAQYRAVRETIIELVLATDFGRHFEMMGHFKAKHSSHTGLDLENKDDRHLLLQIALKCADIAHVAKPMPLHLNWTKRINDEFFAQGDEEQRLGLPVSAFADRAQVNVAKSQCGFIELLVLPLFKLWAEQFDAVSECLSHINANLEHWKSRENDPDMIPKPRAADSAAVTDAAATTTTSGIGAAAAAVKKKSKGDSGGDASATTTTTSATTTRTQDDEKSSKSAKKDEKRGEELPASVPRENSSGKKVKKKRRK